MKHVIYDEVTRESYSEEYFLNHVEKYESTTDLDSRIIGDYINHRFPAKLFHIDTYLNDGIWRVQLALYQEVNSSRDARAIASFINHSVKAYDIVDYTCIDGVTCIYVLRTFNLKFK